MTPIPEPMYVALAGLMQAVVDRDYVAVVAFSRGRLEPADVRRRLEEDYEGPIVLLPREHYDGENVLMDDSASPGFALELWDGEGVADMSLIGYLEPRPDGTYDVLLRDIIP